MTTNEKSLNEKICKWLGFQKNLATTEENYWWKWDEKGNDDMIEANFLHDRDQQKWIIDKLKSDGWTIITTESKDQEECRIQKESYFNTLSIMPNSHSEFYMAETLIQAVEQLIDKENENNKNNL